MGLFSSVKRAFKRVGSALKGKLGTILGVVAAIAVPFIAPVIASSLVGSAFLGGVVSSLGTTATSTLIGAGLGAGVGALTGQGALSGAITGGLGSFAAAGGLGSLFGGAAGAAPGGGAGVGTALGAPATAGVGAAGTGTVAFGAGTGAAAGGTAAGLGSSISSLVSSVKLGDLAPLALAMFNKPPSELTTEERAYLADTAQAASQNEALFREKLAMAQSIRSAGPSPEQAYQQTAEAIGTQAREAERRATLTGSAGSRAATERQAAIAQGLGGGLAAAQAGQQQVQNLANAAGAMPTAFPEDRTSAARLAISRGRESQAQNYYANLGTGFGRLFGGASTQDEEDRRRQNQTAGLTLGDMGSALFG